MSTIYEAEIEKRVKAAVTEAIQTVIVNDSEDGGKGFLEIHEVLDIIEKMKNDITTTIKPTNTEDTEYVTEIHPEVLNINLEEMDDIISDKISDLSGFCHTGFEWKLIVNANLDKSE